MDSEPCFLVMEISSKVILKMILLMEKENLFLEMMKSKGYKEYGKIMYL